MLNLLPEYKKKTLRRTYLLRVGVVGLWLMASAIGLGAVTLAPTYFATTLDIRTLEAERAILEEQMFDSGEGGSVLEVLKRDAALTRLVATLGTTVPPSDYLDEVLEERTEDIFIDSVRFQEDPDGKKTLVVRGGAETREDLVEFTGALEEHETFESVSLPLQDLARKEDVEFTVSLVIAQ